jgi:hypothetical protein
MDKAKAIEILQQILNQAVKAGVFADAGSVVLGQTAIDILKVDTKID